MAGQNNVPPDWAGWKRDLLNRLDAPSTPANDAFLNAWARKEGGGGQNNPFNTTFPLAGATNLAGNSAGVKNYPLPDEGAAATYFTLTGDSRYGDVLGDLRAGRASTRKCYSGLRVWSGGGYCSLANIPTTPPAGSSGVGEVGNPMADQGYGPAYNATSGCHLRTASELPTSPFGTTQHVDICWDKPVGSLAIAGGGVLILAGVAVIVMTGFAESRAARTAAAGLSGVTGPAGKAAAAIGAQRPAQRRARATARAEQQAAEQARRQAPIRAEARREAAHVAAQRRYDAAARRRARHANAAERRRAESHGAAEQRRQARFDEQYFTRRRRGGQRPGRTVPPADDPAPF